MLSPPQEEVIRNGLLSSGFSCILQMPTGSGKTWLAERAIAEVLDDGGRAVYLTPLRALAEQLAARWRTRFGTSRVGIFTGDYGAGKPYPLAFRDARLMVMTPERLDACTRAWRSHWEWIPEVDLLVVDEIHLLGDANRGARLEGTLMRLRRLNPFLRILGLSATLGNRHELADWLAGVEYGSNWRPIAIQWRVLRYRKATEKPDLLIREVTRNLGNGGKSLVFVQSRRRAEELSSQLRQKGIEALHHHAGLGHGERQQVEEQFRTGSLQALVATATLEMGVNLPVRQVLLYDLQGFDGTDFRPLSTNSVWQRVGRAGRPGLDATGEAVLLAPAWDAEAAHYERGKFEPIRSVLADRRNVAEQVIIEAASGLSRTRGQIRAALALSLAAQQQRLDDVDSVLDEMCAAGMLREVQPMDGARRGLLLQATRLGRIAVRHLLRPATVLRFRRLLDSALDLTFFDILLVLASSEDCEPVLPVDFEELDSIADGAVKEPSTLLQLPRGEIVGHTGVDGKRLLASLKMALMAREWTRLSDVEEVADRFGCYPFEVVRLYESMERLLLAMMAVWQDCRACGDVPELADEEHVPVGERLRALHTMLAAGLDEAAATLTLVPGIGPALAKRLCAAGVGDLEDLALADAAELAAIRGISMNRAAQWIEEATTLVRSRPASRYLEQGRAASVRLQEWPTTIDPYRLRRALDLTVTVVARDRFQVAGGLEPHQVRRDSAGQYECDCGDAARGHTCKHVLAIRLREDDAVVKGLVGSLRTTMSEDHLDLFQLWFGAETNGRRRRSA
jgi:helicase